MDETRKNEITAVLLSAVSIFLFLSIFTFSEQDLSFYTSTPNSVSRNLTGIIGSYTGFGLLFVMGQAAYVMPLLVMIWSVSRFLQVGHKTIFFKLFGTIFLIAAVSASLSLMNYSSATVSFSQGGIIGLLISRFLLKYLGMMGAVVFIVATIILSLITATEFLLFPAIIWMFRKLKVLAVRLLQKRKQLFDNRPVSAGDKENKLKMAKQEIKSKIERIRKQVEEARRSTSKDKGEPVQRRDTARHIKQQQPKVLQRSRVQKPKVVTMPDKETGKTIDYKVPSSELLVHGVSLKGDKDKQDNKAALLERTLLEFGVAANVVKINRGPVVTMYELEPAMGTRVNKITSLEDNISLAMKSTNIRIVAPLPGKGTIGIEVPNAKSEIVRLRDIIELEAFHEIDKPLKIALGKDISGDPIILDIGDMPHMLIAGATGSGKTVCINCLISSLLLNSSPDELKFIMVDPKRVELMMFEGIPHLALPIVTNPKKVDAALTWVIGEMERRYDVFAERGVRNITSYKERSKQDWEQIPYIVVIIDELADLMAVAQQDIEGSIMRLAQLSRAAGIHMVIATQRPSVNVITGVIKANIPARISFKVSSKVDSRTVLDANGAETLLGKGDMLIMEPGRPDLYRGQCSLVEDSEIRDVVNFIKEQSGEQYIKDALASQEKKKHGVNQEKDDLYEDALRIVIETKQASVSMIQRRLRVGYTRAARMVDIMEAEGIVGPYNGSKPREIFYDSLEEIEDIQ